jgi:hypothetical protein
VRIGTDNGRQGDEGVEIDCFAQRRRGKEIFGAWVVFIKNQVERTSFI